MTEVLKRLSFGDTTLHQPEFPDIHQVLQAASQPSIEHFQRALRDLDEANYFRFVKIKDVAREQYAGCGESDLRRLKRQFASHKNSYMLFDVKQSFLEGVADGLPDGSEEAQMPAVEQEVEKHSAEVKQYKERNAQMHAEIEELIESITATYKEFGQKKAEIASHLEYLLSEEAQRSATAHPPLPEIEEGPDEEACKSLLAREAAHARALEAALASEEAERKELLAAIHSEEEEIQALREQIEELEVDEPDDRTMDVSARLAESAAWLDALMDVMTCLGGVKLLSTKQNPVQLRLTTYIPDPTSKHATRLVHDLAVELAASCHPSSVTLQPPDFAVDDIVAAAKEGPPGLAFLVQEIQARIIAHHGRLPAIEEAQGKYSLAAVGKDRFEVQLASGVKATVVVPLEWPAVDQEISLAALTTASGVAMSKQVVQKVLEGSPPGLRALLDHISTEVARAFA